ncbi:hypothetical protein HZI73_03570 [Vallitalea pronyensis]|uniref:Transglutaminase-like domain-containing protein n=1 Tax=Vallitalea pronyensis TaxID=1348613 RepID=A0A8J8SFK2_9FIRM|nr:transglutaminase domain-containing protein [Vallitalea pronyensis]QUI21419.1 hypothetical protein HZI73_03570 [Vallitalea pronyensis]
MRQKIRACIALCLCLTSINVQGATTSTSSIKAIELSQINVRQEVHSRIENYRTVETDTTIRKLEILPGGIFSEKIVKEGSIVSPTTASIQAYQKAILEKVTALCKERDTYSKSSEEHGRISKALIDTFSPMTTCYKVRKDMTLMMNNRTLEQTLQDLDDAFNSIQRVIHSEREAVHVFQHDQPSKEHLVDIAKAITDGRVPEKFQKDFQRAITLGEFLEIAYAGMASTNSLSFLDRITIKDKNMPNTYPDYAKLGYVAGIVNRMGDLKQTLTREQMAKYMSYLNRRGGICTSVDYMDVSPDVMDFATNDLLHYTHGYFHPKAYYRLEDAIVDTSFTRYYYTPQLTIRGILPYTPLGYAGTIILDGSTVILEDIYRPDYFFKDFKEMVLNNIPFDPATQLVDTGAFYVDMDMTHSKMTLTIKKDITAIAMNFDWSQYNYYHTLESGKNHYNPVPLAKGTPLDMQAKDDKTVTLLRQKIQEVIKQIITPDMSQRDQLKAIHDYVAKTIHYHGPPDYLTAENALAAITKGEGVCVHYTALFQYFCQELGIPNRVIMDNAFVGRHAWNVVYVNNQWYHIDVTLDDTQDKLRDRYFMKTSTEMVPTHHFSGFGSISDKAILGINPMAIQSTEEFQIFIRSLVMKYEYQYDQVNFRITNPNVDLDTSFMKYLYKNYTFSITGDHKTGFYTVTKTELP